MAVDRRRGRAGDLAFQYDSPCRIIQMQGAINTKVWAWPSPSPDRAITFEGLQVRVDGSIVGCTRTASSASADGAFNRKKMKSHETLSKSSTPEQLELAGSLWREHRTRRSTRAS
jgi:hypothetical protein